MWFRSLFDAWLSRSSRTPVSRSRCKPRVRPLLEILEDRALLSTYTVNALTDTGAGSGLTGDLRYCVTNATSGSDTITFAAGLTGTIQLQNSLPQLNANVTFQGPGANLLTVARYGLTVGSAADVQISGLTISNALQAIWNNGTATVSYCTLSGNGGSEGGAIYNDGNLTVNNSTISGNTVVGSAAHATGTGFTDYRIVSGGDGAGGGIYTNGGTLSINSSTIAGNEAIGGSTAGYSYGLTGKPNPAGNGVGGGLYIAGGTVSIDNSTIADNQTVGGSGKASGFGYGGGIYNAAGPGALLMHDTILAYNTEDVAGDLDGGVTSKGYNLIGDSTGGSGFAASDLLNIDPQLGPLQNYGGPTQTMALLFGSPAVNGGDPSDSINPNTPAYDQRGPSFPRIFGGRIDIGAFELQDFSGLTVSGFPATIKAGATTGNSFTITARNTDGSTDTSYTGTVVLSSTDPTATFYDAATGTPLSGNSYAFQPGDNGTHTFTAVLTQAGYQSITATDTTNAGFMGSEGNILVEAAAASTMSVSGFPSPIDATVPGNFTVTLKDRYDNNASGYTGTVQFSTSDPQATIIDPTTGKTVALQGFVYIFTTADAGVHTFRATMETTGTQSITATDTTTPNLTGTDGGITVNPAPASQFLVSAPASLTAGQSFTFTVTAADNLGRPVTDYTGTVQFSTMDPQATIIDPTTGNIVLLQSFSYNFTAGDGGTKTFTATLKTEGTQWITATDSAGPTGTDAGTTVLSAAASRLALSGFPASITAGTSGALTVTAYDPYGNVANSFADTLHFSTSAAKFTIPADTTLTNGTGQFSATLFSAGTQSISVTDTTMPNLTATESGITVNPAAASKFILAAPASVNAGQSFSLTVTVEDAYNNLAVSYAGTVHFSTTDPKAKLPKNYTFTASDKGVHTFTALVLHTKGNQTITITDSQSSSLTGSVVVDVLSATKPQHSNVQKMVVASGQDAASQDASWSWRDWELGILPYLDAEDRSHREQPL
jgi:hypothetical protein